MSRRDPLRLAPVLLGLGLAVLLVAAWASTGLGEYSVMTMGHLEDGRGGEGAPADVHRHGSAAGGSAGAGAGSAGSVATGGPDGSNESADPRATADADAPAGPGPTGGPGADPVPQAGTSGAPVDVRTLVADPARTPDVRVELTAARGTVHVDGGREVEGYTVNGQSPGPTLRVVQGQLVEVVLVNESVPDGVTLHWHGVDVPNAADGVAGVTQDAVPVGGRFTYRFVASDAGTYWYHSHQVSHEQVVGGLFGALVVEPREGVAEDVDEVAVLHVYAGQHTLGGSAADLHVDAEPGTRARIRVVNTDQGTAAVWSGAPYRVLATDGHDVDGPTPVVGRKLLLPAGGRADVEVTVPDAGAVRLHVGGARSVVVGPSTPSGGSASTGGSTSPDPAAVPAPTEVLDLMAYGTPGGPAALGFDPGRADRFFDYVIGRRIGIIDRRPGMYWTINGRMFPDVPMYHVEEGDIVQFRIVNETSEVHPMHLHGHHAVVLTHDGVASSGAPWVVDSLDVHPGEEYEIAFVADNPGIWVDHCHQLQHAVDGLIAHLMYEGVTTPFLVNGTAANHPE